MRDEETWEQIELPDSPSNEEMLAHILAPRWMKGPPKIEGVYLTWDGKSTELVWLESDGNSLQFLSNAFGDEVTDVRCHFPVPNIPEKLRDNQDV